FGRILPSHDTGGPSVARLTLLHIWGSRSRAPERISARGGFLVPGYRKLEARVASLGLSHPRAPLDPRIPVRSHTRGGFLAPFGVRLHSKTSSFLERGDCKRQGSACGVLTVINETRRLWFIIESMEVTYA